jgi:hypothetical protein
MRMEPHRGPLVHVIDCVCLGLLPLVPFLPLFRLGDHGLTDRRMLLDEPDGGVDRADGHDPMILAQVGRPHIEHR